MKPENDAHRCVPRDACQSDAVCFGDLDTVFPMQSNGLRATPEACLRCARKTECLRAAMAQRNGLRVREEMLERAYRGGVIGFFQRWSQRKSIHRLQKDKSSTP